MLKELLTLFLVAIFKSLPCLTCSHKEMSWQVTDPFTKADKWLFFVVSTNETQINAFSCLWTLVQLDLYIS